MGTRVANDLHVGAGGGVAIAKQLLLNSTSPVSNLSFGITNLETNDGTHTLLRAVKEAADLNEWMNCFQVDGTGAFCKRLLIRTSSFCSGRSGAQDTNARAHPFSVSLCDTVTPNGDARWQ
jgi:hypothetical protein